MKSPKTLREVTVGQILDAWLLIEDVQKVLGAVHVMPRNIIVNTPVHIKLQGEDPTIVEAAKKILKD